MRPGPVVVVEVLAQDLDEVALAQDDQPIQTLSPSGAKHPLAGSVRARARNGVRAILTPAAKKTVSKSELYFESRSWIRTLIGIFSSSSSHATFRAWLCHPGRVGMCGGVAEDDTARADVQEDEHVQDTQADAVDGQEVARPDRAGVSAEKLRPNRAGAPWRRAQSITAKDLVDRRVRDPIAELEEFTLNPALAPSTCWCDVLEAGCVRWSMLLSNSKEEVWSGRRGSRPQVAKPGSSSHRLTAAPDVPRFVGGRDTI
jgi:hypothetical protein